jgi:hypothetical protein
MRSRLYSYPPPVPTSEFSAHGSSLGPGTRKQAPYKSHPRIGTSNINVHETFLRSRACGKPSHIRMIREMLIQRQKAPVPIAVAGCCLAQLSRSKCCAKVGLGASGLIGGFDHAGCAAVPNAQTQRCGPGGVAAGSLCDTGAFAGTHYWLDDIGFTTKARLIEGNRCGECNLASPLSESVRDLLGTF